MGTLRIPACWNQLIETDFPEGLEGIVGAKQRTDIADPKPYYDDSRSVAVSLSDGTAITLFLSSGQGNYYGAYSIWKNAQCIQPDDDMVLEYLGDIEFQIREALRADERTSAVADAFSVEFV